MNPSSPPLARAEGPAAWAGVLLAFVPPGACSKPLSPAHPDPSPNRPPGSVLVLNGTPIHPEEVDEVGDAYAFLEPQDTPLQLRRIALSRSVFPRIAAQGLEPARRTEAEKLARSYRSALEAGNLPAGPLAGPMEIERKGRFLDLGFEMWRTALQAEPGKWSQVLETPGSFHILRVKSREEGSLPSLTWFTIGVFDFPYLDPETARATIEAALDRSRLTILDESWRDAVPAAWRYRLHAESP
jgi:hypothetical protein